MEQNNALARKFNAASLLRFALPNIAMMMLLSMYTIVDGMFISRFAGTTALSAINMSYPLNCLQMATGIMLGTGGSAIIARRQGEGRTDEARRNFTMLIAVALGIGLIFAVFGNLFLNPILRLLGTSELQWADCRIYTRIQLVFAPMLFLQTAFQTLFVTAGKPGLGLLTSVGGGITNVVLDWLFMGPMNMGVAGAAIATLGSRVISAVVPPASVTACRPSLVCCISPKTALEVCTLCPSNLMAQHWPPRAATAHLRWSAILRTLSPRSCSIRCSCATAARTV